MCRWKTLSWTLGNLTYPGQPPIPIPLGQTNPVVTSGNTNVVKVLDGIVTGAGVGATTLTIVYAYSTGIFTGSCPVTVHATTFRDDFGVSHDYLHQGVAGTIYDGIYDVSGYYPIPGSAYVPPVGNGTLGADAKHQ